MTRRILQVSFAAVFVAACAFCAGVAAARAPASADTPAPAARLTPQPYTLPLAYAQEVIYYADESGVPVWLAARLFAWESGWQADYRGRTNPNGTHDYGIAALNSASLATFAALYNDGRAVDPMDPETSIRVGIRYLAALHARWGSWPEAVRRYAGNRPIAHVRAILGS